MGYSHFQERNGDVVFFIQGLLFSLLFSLNSNYDEELSPIKFIDSEPHGDFLFFLIYVTAASYSNSFWFNFLVQII